MPIKLSVADTMPPDSIDVARGSKRHFWRAAAEVVGLNLSLNAFDRWVVKGKYARINLHTISENFRHGFIWDNDKLGTNMFLHPYNGNLYFNAARSNGFNFWQSELFAIGGSAMWELFMEREYPSTNDVIATPVGGAAIGEVLFRASDVVIDDRLTGWSRFGREAAVFALSPMRSLTRIFTGDAWRRRPTRGRMFGTPNVGVEFSLGPKFMEFRHSDHNYFKAGCELDINLEYGDRFEVHSTQPYDYFTFHGEVTFMSTQPVLSQLQITGRLIARELLDSRQRQDLSLGIYQHFDFYDSDSLAYRVTPYKLGVPASLGIGAMYRNFESKRAVFDAYAHFNGVFLGGVLSDYYNLGERTYNWAMGLSAKAGFQVVFDHDKFSMSLSSAIYRLYTFKGYPKDTDMCSVNIRTLNAMGDDSEATFGITRFIAQLRLWKHVYLGLEAKHLFRHTHYRDYPAINSSTFTQSLQIIYKL